MMPNNIEKDIDQVIKMANSHNNPQKYALDIEDSKKMKKANKLKIKPGYIIALAVGIVIVVGMVTYFIANKQSTPTQNPNPELIPEPNPAPIVHPVETTEKQYIKKYSNMYGLDRDKVYNIYLNNKDYFNSINYLSVSKYEGYNLELEILTFVRHLYQKSGDFNVNLSSITSSNPILENGIKEEEIVKYYSELFGVDPVLVLAIEYHEASLNEKRYASDAYLSGNNPAGLIDPSTGLYWKFPSKVSGIIEHIYQLKKYFIDRGLTTPEEIKGTYAPDGADNDPNNLNTHWVDSVNALMEEIRANDVSKNKGF